MKTIIASLSKDDLINLFATAIYGNDGIEVKTCKKPGKKAMTIEESIANVLLEGGNIEITDLYSEERKSKPKHYGKNHISVRWKPFIVDKYFADEQGEWGHMIYTINLKNIIDGINNSKSAKEYAHTLFDESDGDFYTAYNLLQLIVFGKEVYG